MNQDELGQKMFSILPERFLRLKCKSPSCLFASVFTMFTIHRMMVCKISMHAGVKTESYIIHTNTLKLKCFPFFLIMAKCCCEVCKKTIWLSYGNVDNIGRYPEFSENIHVVCPISVETWYYRICGRRA